MSRQTFFPLSPRRCHLLFRILFWIVVSTANVYAQSDDGNFKIVGYLPDYRVGQIDPALGKQLTDLVFFSVVPEPHGRFVSKVLDSPRTGALLNKFREEHHVAIHICVGGWDRSQGFAEISATAESRIEFAKGLTAYCRTHEFAGADLDWEHPKGELEATNYGRLLAEIARAFQPHKLRLTAAIASWQTLTPQAIEAIDAVNLMSYDGPGKHSTLDAAKADVRKLLDAGVPAKKIRLGLPFYGRGVTRRDDVKTYAEIVAAESKSVDLDEVNGLYFNGPTTIRAKVRFANEQQLGGVMIWEIGQDAAGDASLLKTVREAAKFVRQ